MGKELRLSWILIAAVLLTALLTGCGPRDYSHIPAYSKNKALQAVIEIPAGTNLKISYCMLSHRFRVEMMDGVEKKVKYLPYPANYGFIPSTRLDNRPDNSGDMLDVMVISEELEVGEVVEVVPLGMLILKDDFHTDYTVIAIPSDEDHQVVHAHSYDELMRNYPALIEIVETWLINSELYENPVLLGWEDEHVAMNFINKWVQE